MRQRGYDEHCYAANLTEVRSPRQPAHYPVMRLSRLSQLTIIAVCFVRAAVRTQFISQYEHVGRRFDAQPHLVAGDPDNCHHNRVTEADSLRLSA